MNIKKDVLFISRSDAFNLNNIVEFLSNNYNVTKIVKNRNKKLSKEDIAWEGDYIFSYLCPWVLSSELINNAKIAAINFHPGPPAYPGTGCYNFAIYNQEKEYGVTCHHLAASVDTGDIISVKKFPLLKHDSVSELINRTYTYLNLLFYEIILELIENSSLPKSVIKWERKPFKRIDLNELCKLSRKMTEEEINRRKKATTYPGKPGPYFID